MQRKLPLVLDGDGTSLFRAVAGHVKALITMNKNEFLRVWAAVRAEEAGEAPLAEEPNMDLTVLQELLSAAKDQASFLGVLPLVLPADNTTGKSRPKPTP